MATSSEIQVTEAYIGLLGRAPDPAGLAYWTAELDAAIAGGQSAAVALKKLTNDITLSSEWDTGIGANDATTEAGSEAIVTAMYNNLFERVATQAELDYWAPKIVSGEFTASEMAVALIQGAGSIDGQVLGYKQQAATYYVETVDQDSFSRESAGEAVDPVNGPMTLQSSQTATDYVSTGVGVTTVLTTSDAAGMDVTMTAGADTVTGVVGTGVTYASQNVVDTSSADNDTFTLTGDAGFTFDNIDKVENVNVNLSDTLGAGFTIAGVNNVLNSTINVDVADQVTIVGVDLDGETVVTMTGALTSNVTTTDVTSLTATTGDAALSITGDADLATLQVDDIADDGTTITLSAATVDLDLDGTADTNDSVTISAVGAVDLDLSDTVLVEEVSLSGNGAAVTYDVNATATGASMTYTVTGDQDVTLQGAPASLTAATLTDSSTAGSTTVVLADAAGAADLTAYGLLSGGVTVAVDLGANELNAVSGSTIKVTAAQATGVLTIDANDAANDTSMTLDLDANTLGITTEDIDTLTVDLGSVARTIGGILEAQGNNDTAVTIAGTNDLTMTDELATGNLTMNVDDASLEELDADGTASITTSGDLTLTAAFGTENDATIVADDVDLQTTVTVEEGNLSITTTNDATLTGAVDVDGTLTATAGGTALIEGASAVENDVTLSGDDVTISGVDAAGAMTVAAGNISITTTNDADINGDITTTAGNISITSGKDVDVDGAFDASGTLTVSQTGTAGSINFSDTLASDNDMTMTGDDVVVTGATTVAGDMSLTATGNDITVGGTIDTSGNLTLTTENDAGGDIVTTGQTVGADNDITMTSADLINAGAINSTAAGGTVTLTAGNEITIGTASDIDGTLTATSSGAAAAGMVTIGGALTMENDVTLTGDEVDINANITIDVGTATATAANDVDIDANITATAGSISVTANSGSVGAGADVIVGAAGNTLTASNDITVTGDDVTVGDMATSATGDIAITATNDVSTLGDIDGDNVATVSTNVTITAGNNIALTSGGGEYIVANNDVTISATGGGNVALNAVTLQSDIAGDITLTGGQIDGSGTITADNGDVIFNSTNDTLTSTLSATITADLGKVEFLGGLYAVSDIDADAGGITIAGDSTGTFGALQTTGSAVRITSSGNVTTTSIDAGVIVASGAGDYVLGNVTSTNSVLVQITTGSGDDSMTLTQALDEYHISTGDGADSVSITAAETGSVINLGLGVDTITPTRTGYAGVTIDGGDGSDTVVLGAGDHSADGVWTNIEVINLAGATTLSGAQLANDTTFQITGTNSVVTATGVTTIDLSEVTFQAGNTSSFDITGHATADSTLTGSDAGDTLTGVAGDDTLSGGIGNDTLEGANGDDTLLGGSGNDDLFGAAGANTLTGGLGNDIFNLVTTGTATITDFATGDDIDTTALTVTQGATSQANLTTAAAGGKALVASAQWAANAANENGNGVITVTDQAAADWNDAGTLIGAALTVDGTAGNNGKFVIIIDNGTDTRVYYYSDVTNGFAAADDLTLLGTVSGKEVADFAAGDFAP